MYILSPLGVGVIPRPAECIEQIISHAILKATKKL